MTTAFVRPDILYAWKGPSVLIVNARGECGGDQAFSGFYFRETRFLRTLQLLVNGEPPWLCESATLEPDCLALNYVYPEIKEPGGGGTGHSGDDIPRDEHGIPERSFDLRVSYQVQIAALRIVLTLTNRARRPLSLVLSWNLDADYADIQEAQAGRREQQADVDAATPGGHIEFIYRHPELRFRTEIHYETGWTAHEGRLTAEPSFQPQETKELSLSVIPLTGDANITWDQADDRATALDGWRRRFARVVAPGNRTFEQVLACNVRDFASFPLLDGPRDEWLAMQAGMPLYPAFFGRDSLTAGWQAGYVDRGEALDATLTKLSRLQSHRFDDWHDEQPGRIPYQVRSGPLALLSVNPYSAYYADYASPLMFVISVANLWAWTGRRQDIQRHWDTARRILDWAREFGDMDGDGFLEYQTRSSRGTKNQGWKDSGDAVVYDDGRPVPPPIATCELQGYWYSAQKLMALLSWVMGARADAAEYRRRASELKQRFNRDWWIEGENFFALALDPDKRKVPAITSNVGHCLASGIIDDDRLPAVVDRLFAPDLFSGWGVRTLSADHLFYNPLSYHRGTVWAVEQATLVFGLRRFGFDARALELAQAVFDLAQLYPEFRIPECVGGYARSERATPGAYPRANTPQLWNATAWPLIVQTILGLLPIAAINTLVVDPALPEWLPELTMHDLRVGEATVTLRFWRNEKGESKWEVVRQNGTLHLLRQPPPESLWATWKDRASAALESLLK